MKDFHRTATAARAPVPKRLPLFVMSRFPNSVGSGSLSVDAYSIQTWLHNAKHEFQAFPNVSNSLALQKVKLSRIERDGSVNKNKQVACTACYISLSSFVDHV